ncbi:unnamed protein product, partial [Ostreobium quekettii]
SSIALPLPPIGGRAFVRGRPVPLAAHAETAECPRAKETESVSAKRQSDRSALLGKTAFGIDVRLNCRRTAVHTSKVKKKGKEWKAGHLDKIRESFDQYPRLVVFRYSNFRTRCFQELRTELRNSTRFFIGRDSLLRFALGKTKAEEYRPNLHELSELLRGEVGLLFTKLTREQVSDILKNFEEEDFARAGSRATVDFAVPKGPLEGFSHTLEPNLRGLGLPTKLNKGVIELITDHEVCKQGDVLTPKQAGILKAFGMKTAIFKFEPLCLWEDGSVVMLDGDMDEDL